MYLESNICHLSSVFSLFSATVYPPSSSVSFPSPAAAVSASSSHFAAVATITVFFLPLSCLETIGHA